MSKHVWVCKTPMDSTAVRGYRPVDFKDDGTGPGMDAVSERAKRSSRFIHDEPGQMPQKLFSYKSSKAHKKAKRHMFYNGQVFISEESAEVLRAHDMGATTLVPVTLLHPDRETEVPGPWYYLQVRDAKESVLPEESEGLRLMLMQTDLYRFFTSIADDAIKVRPSALDEPDI